MHSNNQLSRANSRGFALRLMGWCCPLCATRNTKGNRRISLKPMSSPIYQWWYCKSFP